MALEVRSLSKNYGKVQALKNVSFKIGTGVYGLLGPNGAGKSTMIRIITGSMRASSGEVLYNGSRIRENEKAYKKILGYVPQRQGMYDSFTAARFLEYMAVLKELKRKKIPEEVERGPEDRGTSGGCAAQAGRILRRLEAACAHRAGAAGGSQDHHPG